MREGYGDAPSCAALRDKCLALDPQQAHAYLLSALNDNSPSDVVEDWRSTSAMPSKWRDHYEG
jgi:hypothetical protein